MIDAVDILRRPDETRSKMWLRDGVEMDLVTHDPRESVRLMVRRNGYVLEQLLSPLVVHTTTGAHCPRSSGRSGPRRTSPG
jgi:predicted nucleotidyltransferase